MKIFITLILFFMGISGEAQTTAIPDPNFEQALIDLGIDNDGTVNGQVLTADIASITVLNISEHYLEDLTGIEDFSELKVLDISHTGFSGGPFPYLLNLSHVHSLEELYMNSDLDNFTVEVNYLDLSNNQNLKKIEIRDNLSIERIYLQGGDLGITNLLIDLTGSNACIQVTNADDAQNGQGVYATWNLCCGGAYSENCNLDKTDFVNNNIRLFPNPATEIFTVNSQKDIKKINIYDLQGKLVKRFTQVQKNYSVADMPTGIYMVEVRNFSGSKQLINLVKK